MLRCPRCNSSQNITARHSIQLVCHGGFVDKEHGNVFSTQDSDIQADEIPIFYECTACDVLLTYEEIKDDSVIKVVALTAELLLEDKS